MDRRDVLKALLAGGAVAALPSASYARLTEEEFTLLTMCANLNANSNPTLDRDGAAHALMDSMEKRGLLKHHANVDGRGVDGKFFDACYETTDYGRSVLRAECERGLRRDEACARYEAGRFLTFDEFRAKHGDA